LLASLAQSVVKMVPECRDILKSVCQINGVTVSDYLYDCARLQIHKQATCCPLVSPLLKAYGKKIDQRIYKSCSGFHCQICDHKEACALGEYEGLFEMDAKSLLACKQKGYRVETTYEEQTIMVQKTVLIPIE
jgi:hypothetical protein|tara:strand:- start:3802 stop:4200 length:399 start_codon:yes stop_codon:yes gene_type:complete